MTLRLVARWSGTNPVYAPLARVLDFSARAYNPGWLVDVVRTRRQPLTRYDGFRQKAIDWFRAVRHAPEGTPIALLDVDMLITGSLDPVWDEDFDIAVTMRETAREQLNSGAMFVRASTGTVAFLERWMRRTSRLAKDPKTRKFSDQHALAQLLETTPLRVKYLPCRVWNCEQTHWKDFSSETRIVHIKSDVRGVIFGHLDACLSPGGDYIVSLWREWDRRAREAAA